MIQKSILEQLGILVDIFMSNKNVLVISIASIIVFILLNILNHFKSKKITKIILIGIYVITFGLLIYFYNSQLLILIDYLIDNIFILMFFPNLAVYTFVIITANILLVKSLFGNHSKLLKNISILFFIIFNIIFYLIIDSIIKNNISVYEQLNVYSNSNLLVLIQISMYVFIGYLLILLISKIANHIALPTKVRVKESVVEPVVVKEIKPTISSIPEVTPNTLVVANEELKNIKSANIYNNYIDIEPIKKKKVEIMTLSNMDDMFMDKNISNNMNILFGSSNNTLSNIMNDIESLKGNLNNQNQIKKIYEQISLNSKDLTLKDYNYLINALKEIKNNN